MQLGRARFPAGPGWVRPGADDRRQECTAINLRSLFDVFLPIHTVWWAIFGQTLTYGLSAIYHFLAANPALSAIGAYGLAIMVLTLIVRLVLAPLFQLQLSLSRRSMQQQKKLAPQLAELRKKYKNDPQKQQAAMMELYREHGVNPLASLSGCLPALLQFPILSALYYVFFNARNQHFADHFLFVPHLNEFPNHQPLVPGLPIPTFVYLVIPILAAATTFVQSRMMQQPPSAVPTEQELQQQQMTRTMQVMMPLMIAYFAFVTPAGLGLYWFVSNCVSIVQQYFVTGWGGLRRQPAVAPAAPAAAPSAPPARNAKPLPEKNVKPLPEKNVRPLPDKTDGRDGRTAGGGRQQQPQPRGGAKQPQRRPRRAR
jgi:YidC/Oxa1 family membrane protein insertase